MTVDLLPLLAAAASLTVVVGGVAAALVAIRRWIRNVATPAQDAAHQLATSNGTTVANYVERVAGDVTDMKQELSVLGTWATENREIAQSALTLARHIGERLDAHLVGHEKRQG